MDGRFRGLSGYRCENMITPCTKIQAESVSGKEEFVFVFVLCSGGKSLDNVTHGLEVWGWSQSQGVFDSLCVLYSKSAFL
jgi:hypothetical protein